jgi:tetratricopeptide (TPR) repeat protein
MKRFLVLSVFIFLTSVICFAQTELSPSDWKMTQAKLLTEDNKFADALIIYEELYVTYPEDAFLNFRIALCHFTNGNSDNAKPFIDKAVLNCKNPEIYGEICFLKSKIYHRIGDFATALSCLESIPVGSANVDSLKVKFYKSQINNAAEYSKSSGSLTPVNCGEIINSNFNEFYPVFSAWSNKLYFTSDRNYSETQEKNLVTHAYPYSIFESVIKENNIFETPFNPDETFATGKNFILNAVSAGDNTYFLYKNTPEVADRGDIYTDTKDTEEDFTDSERINGTYINTENYEGSCSFDYINNVLYFVSTRKDKSGANSDIFKSEFFKGKFPEPEFMNNLSTAYDESFVWVNPGGEFMVVAADNDKSGGGYDLFISFNKDGKWSAFENLGFPFNSPANETQFTLSSDGKTAYIASDRAGGFGGFDIYSVDFEKYITEKLGFLPANILVSGQVTDEELIGVEADIKIIDKSNSKKSQSVKTDKDGYYVVNLRCDKRYTVEVKNKTFAPLSTEIDLSGVLIGEIVKDFELVGKE